VKNTNYSQNSRILRKE